MLPFGYLRVVGFGGGNTNSLRESVLFRINTKTLWNFRLWLQFNCFRRGHPGVSYRPLDRSLSRRTGWSPDPNDGNVRRRAWMCYEDSRQRQATFDHPIQSFRRQRCNRPPISQRSIHTTRIISGAFGERSTVRPNHTHNMVALEGLQHAAGNLKKFKRGDEIHDARKTHRSHCRIGSLPPGAALLPYPGFSASYNSFAQGVIGGSLLRGIPWRSIASSAGSLSPLGPTAQTPVRSRFGVFAGIAEFAGGFSL